LTAPCYVTGIGAVSAFGIGTEALWKGLLSGRTAVSPLRRFDGSGLRSPLVAEAPDPGGDFPNRTDRLAFAAAREALSSAGLEALPEQAGVATGAGVGGLPESEEAFGAWLAGSARTPSLRTLTRHMPATTADLLCLAFGARGPRCAAASACASSTTALALGAAWISLGETDCVLAGGADALTRMTVGGFNSLRLVASEPPRPFDRSRSGMAVGEGAAFLVLESFERVRERGARPLAALSGWGLSTDAHHATAPHPEGRGALAALQAALQRAGATAEEVDAVNAHGTGTRANDSAEAAALVRLLGRRAPEVPVSSVKGALGHCLGAAGALEAVASVLTILRQTVPPTAGLATPEFEGLLLPTAPVERPVGSVLTLNLGFGGHNAALFFRRTP